MSISFAPELGDAVRGRRAGRHEGRQATLGAAGNNASVVGC